MVFHTVSLCLKLFHCISHCFTLFHTVSHCFTLFHNVSYCFLVFHTVSHCFLAPWCVTPHNVLLKLANFISLGMVSLIVIELTAAMGGALKGKIREHLSQGVCKPRYSLSKLTFLLATSSFRLL